MKKAFASLVVCTFILAGCSASTPAQDTSSAVQSESMAPDSTASSAGELANAKAFTVVGSNYSFDTKEIKVKEGDTVQITFQNSEGFHDFRIDEFDAFTKEIGAGQKDTISFVANKKGTFEYYCSVGQHRKMGMVGKLIVE